MSNGKLTKERLEKFCYLLSAIKKIIAIIITHRDPDSMACAKRFAEICRAFGKAVKIFYQGPLEDEQNRCIWNGFNLGEEFLPIEKFLEDSSKYDVIMLDAAPEDSRLEDSTGNKIILDPIIVIDHHPNVRKIEEGENHWYQIEPCGAAITHIMELSLKLEKPELSLENNEDTSTLAVIGLMSDADLRLIAKHTSPNDRAIFNTLCQYADLSRAERTFNAIYTKEYWNYFAAALNNREPLGNIILTNIGYISADNLGLAARFGDKLYLTEGVDIVVVRAISWPDCTTHLKFRSMSERNDLVEYIRKRFGNGGARNGKGAAQIKQASDFYLPNSSEAKLTYERHIDQQVRDKIINPSY